MTGVSLNIYGSSRRNKLALTGGHCASTARLVSNLKCGLRMGAGRSTKEEFVASVIIVSLVIVVFAVVSTVEFVDCPKCKNHEPEKYSCTHCNGDGKVTLLQYLIIVLTKGYSTIELREIDQSFPSAHEFV